MELYTYTIYVYVYIQPNKKTLQILGLAKPQSYLKLGFKNTDLNLTIIIEHQLLKQLGGYW